MSRHILATVLVLAFLLTGCASPLTAPAKAQPTDRDRKQALDAVLGYMENRKKEDLPKAYQFLSKATRELFSGDEFVKYYSQFPRMDWKRVGPVSFVGEDWARVVVYDITVEFKDGTRQVLADFPYYVQKSGDDWGVALINPVLGQFEGVSDRQETLNRSQSLLKVHPYNMNVHIRLFYVYLAGGELERAYQQIGTLYRVSGPSDLATVQVIKGEFFLQTQGINQAVEALEKGLELCKAYPERYTAKWRSNVLTTLARAHIFAGEAARAREALSRALAEDSSNADAKQLLESLSATQS